MPKPKTQRGMVVSFTDPDGGEFVTDTETGVVRVAHGKHKGFISLAQTAANQRRQQQSNSQRARRERERQEKANATK